MQTQIDSIIYSKVDKKNKINQLNVLFKTNKINLFTDLDDTITSTNSLFYLRNKYLKKNKKKKIEEIAKILFKKFKINPRFINTIQNFKNKNLIILTRNEHELVKLFILQNQKIFKENNINILGGIGTMNGFKFSSTDKLNIMPQNSIIISDIFEYKKFKNYKGFICIERYNIFKHITRLFIKMFYFSLFIIKNV